MLNSNYTIKIHPPEKDNQLWGAWCEELNMMTSGKSEGEAFYNLVINIPEYFKVKAELRQKDKVFDSYKRKSFMPRTFKIPSYA